MKKSLVFGMVVACLALTGRVSAQVNGGFETGDFTGWNQFDNTGFTGVLGIFGGINPHEGNFQAFFGPVGSTGGISQTIPGNAGDQFNVSFWLYNFGGTPNFFEASLDGQVITSMTDAAGFEYTQFAGTITVNNANPVLRFTTQQNPSFWLLDDVRVTLVPEPASLSLMGLASLGLWLRRRGKALS